MKLKLRIFALMAILLCFAFQANAQVAKIGETEYSTFGDALTAAGEMSGDVTVEVYDKVTLNTAFSGSYSSINFVGKDTDAEIYLDVQGYITATGKKVSFKDLTLSKSQGGYITNAGFMNVAFGVYDVVEVAYTSCVFANGAYASSGNVTYTDCTFKMSWDKYGLWAYGDVDVTVDGCVFDNYRGIKMYAEGKAKTTELTVKNTNFSALDGDGSKPAIVLTYGASVVLENNTYSSTGTLELDLDGDPNGTAVTSDVAPVCVNDSGACGVLVDGKIYATAAQAAAVATEGSNVTLLYSTTDTVEFAEGVNLTLANGVTADNVTVIVAGLTGEGTAASPFLINNVDDLVWFQKKVDELAADGSTQFADKYFKLTADINLAGINWNPIGSMSGDHGSFKGVFDGDNHTISNLNVEQSGNGIGLFARTAGNAVIKNLKLNNVTVKSTDNSNYVGGVVGNAYASTKIENVHLSGNIYISGRGYIGGIAGHGYVVMDNVSVVATGDGQGNNKGLVTSTFWCAGGILGYGGEGATNIMNANVENVVVTSAAGGLGAIVGMAEDNNGTQPISGSNLSASNVEIKTYTGAYGDSYANYALGYLYGGNPTSKLTGEIKVENVGITTSNGVTPSVNDAVASIDGTIYFSLASAVAAADGKTITLLRDVELTETLTIPADKTIALDLNGKTISQTKEQTAGYQIILNDGKLTIDDSSESKAGKISYTDSGNGGEYISDVIYNRSVLVINGGTIENLSSATVASNGYPHAVDTYSGIRDTYVEINGGTIYCAEYSAIRMFCVSATNKADLVINGGTIKGAVDMQNGTKVAALGTLTINDGTFETTKNANNIRFANWNGGATEYGVSAEIKGGSFNGGITTKYVPAAANWNKGIISGGTYAQDMTDFCAEGFACEQNADGTYGIVEAEVVVAKIGEVEYETLAAALAAAKDGETVTLLWAEGDPAIAMNGAVFGKNVTITGTATVDWSKGWFYVGRGGAGNATVTFDGANLTSASANENSGLGIHVSGREKDTNNKYDGTLVIKNSTIALDYLIDRGAIELGEGAVLTVKNGFGIAGRPASETENGEAATATVTLNNGSKLVVNNHNGMGLGQAAVNLEGFGIMNVNEGATFETTQAFLVTANGTMNVATGGAVNVNGTLTVNGTLVCAGNIAATIAAGDAANIEISGGVYTQNVAEWCIDGYAALPDLNGNYVVGEEPTATVNNLGAMTIPGGEYSIYDGSFKGTTATDPDMPLSFVMQFLADQDEDDMATSPYADWYGDFVLTFTGLAEGSFSAEGCYLAGYYGSFGWVKVPVEGLLSEIEEGVRYPVMLGVGLGQKYDYICTGVKDFRCALYIPETVLEANPNIEVKLELSVVDNSKGQDAAAEALVNGENIYEVGAYEYEAKDFNPGFLRAFTINDADALDYTQAEDKIIGTLTYNRTLIEGIWNPLYLPFSVSLKNLADNYEVAYYNTMHSYDNDNNGTFETFEMEVLKLTANELNDVMLKANYPYFIRPKNADACALQIVETDATLFAAAEKVITTTSVSHTFQLKSTYKALEAADLTGCYAISTDGDWALTAGLKPHRLYLTISANDDSPYATSAAKTIRIVARGDEGFEGTTGVDIVETDNAADGTIYDLSGRPVEEPVKGGMYIINGKKVVY
ncbi:MAG: hypothetical protein IKB11_05255 [Bacteroidaceae bacterium]|nr:hypothetical protein [Bacteroidaceae bacterium]